MREHVIYHDFADGFEGLLEAIEVFVDVFLGVLCDIAFPVEQLLFLAIVDFVDVAHEFFDDSPHVEFVEGVPDAVEFLSVLNDFER